MRSHSDEAELCAKGLHLLTPDNIFRRKIGEHLTTRSCRACYNERMKKYMRKRRRNDDAGKAAQNSG